MRFVAFDVETANSDLASICQIGAVVFEGSNVIESWNTFVNPEDRFDPINIAVHGIRREAAEAAPRFPQVVEKLLSLLDGQIVVHHTPFDRISLARIASKYSLPEVDCVWLDSSRVVRRAWPQFAKAGYGLSTVAKHLGIDFRHHHAEEDARAVGEIMVKAMEETGLDIRDWVIRVRQPIGNSDNSGVTRTGNPEGALVGEVVVFTGSLSMTRQRAADLAALAGCDVGVNVTKQTSLMVVGDQDIRQLAGREKSNKHRKAEELIGKGQVLRIMGEGDFLRLFHVDQDSTRNRIEE